MWKQILAHEIKPGLRGLWDFEKVSVAVTVHGCLESSN